LLLGLIAIFNIIDGIAAVSNSRYVADKLLFANLDAWGWFFLVWGVIQLLAAFAVYKEKTWGVVVAVITLFGNAITQLGAAEVNPVWSLTIVALDVYVMYALIVHTGGRRRAS